MPGEVSVSKCPICGGLWYDGECYKCGAYLKDDKVVVPKPGETPQPPPIAAPPLKQQAPARAWDEP